MDAVKQFGLNQFGVASNVFVAVELHELLVVFENVPGLTRSSFVPYLDYIKAQLRNPEIAPLDPDELWDHHHQRIIASTAEETYRVY